MTHYEGEIPALKHTIVLQEVSIGNDHEVFLMIVAAYFHGSFELVLRTYNAILVFVCKPTKIGDAHVV